MKSLMKPRSILGAIGALTVAGLAVSALVTGVAAAPAAKVDLCHAKGNGSYSPLSVAASAVAGHLKHGDVVQPNGAVPGNPGAVFDANCQVVSWTYAVNASVDPTAQTSGGNLLVGSGIPATNFGTATNEDLGIELGLMVLYRQGPTIASTDNYDDSVLHFSVASGPQSTANGSFANNATRAAWNFTFSVATGLNGATTDLGDYTFQLLYDVDPGAGAVYRTLTAEPGGIGTSGIQWRDAGTGTVFIPDDAGNANVTQNSENYAFAFFQGFLTSPYGPGNAFAGPATFDIILQALDGAQIVVSNHIVVDVAAP